MRNLITFMVFASLAGIAGAQSLIDTRAPEFTLQDQYDKSFSLHQFGGRVLVLIACDKKGKVQNPPWIKAIREKYGDGIALLGAADVRGVPFFLKWKIRNDFKKEYADSVLLDWKGEIFTTYGLAERVANIIVIDRGGTIRFMHAGPADPDAVQHLFDEIDKLGRQ
jgi:predicted transcriptional regulator